MRKLIVAILVVALGLSAYSLATWQPVTADAPKPMQVLGAADAEEACEGVRFDWFLDQAWAEDDLPHFVRGYTQFAPNADRLAMQRELSRWLKTTATQHASGHMLLWGEAPISSTWVISNDLGVLTKEVEVIYGEYSIYNGEVICNYSNGTVYLAEESPKWAPYELAYRISSGAISKADYQAKRKELSWEEFRKVDSFYQAGFIHALDWLWASDEDHTGLEEIQGYLLETAHEQLGISNLNECVPWECDPPLTIGEVLGISMWGRDDLYPDKLYIGPIQAWGWMTTGSTIPLKDGTKPERWMAICEEAMGYDWIRGVPQIIRHEIIHSWQSFPLHWYVDCELFNEMYVTCIDIDQVEFITHGYLSRIRSIALRYWGFDAKEALDYIRTVKVGGVVEINAEKYEKYAAMVNEIAVELRKTSPEVYKEFYSDPLFYTALGELFYDNSIVVDLIYAGLYEPTCLGGVEETQKWQVSNKGKIADIMDEVLDELKDEARDRYAEDTEEQRHWSMVILSLGSNLPMGTQEALIQVYSEGGIDAVIEFLHGGGIK